MQLNASDIILRPCEELHQLCDLNARLADPSDLGESDRLEDLKSIFLDRIEGDKSNFSIQPLTQMWFFGLLVVILSTFLLSTLGSRQNADTGKPCTLVSHLTVTAIYIALVVIIGLWSKRWIVQSKVAGAGPGSPAAANTTYWSVLDLRQTKIGGSFLSGIYIGLSGVVMVW